MTNEQIINNVAQMVRQSMIDALYDEFDVGMSDVTSEMWAELGHKDDFEMFVADKAGALECLASIVGGEHRLVSEFEAATWKAIVSVYYPEELT